MLYGVLEGIHNIFCMMFIVGVLGWILSSTDSNIRIYRYVFFIGLFGAVFMSPIIK